MRFPWRAAGLFALLYGLFHMAQVVAQSIYDVSPIETGGSRAREGFAFQDHVTVGFCLDMLSDPSLLEVWTETQDDVTLIWTDGESLTAEFVQAKSDELNQLWSISKLSERDGNTPGSSIVERSLAYDRCKESALFRVVTSRPFQNELSPLTLDRNCAARNNSKATIEGIADSLADRTGDATSPNGNSCKEWSERVFLDTRHSEDAVKDSNFKKLRLLLEQRHHFALQGQVEEIYAMLVAKVASASKLDARIHATKKRFPRDSFEKILEEIAGNYLSPKNRTGGGALEAKMKQAGLPTDTIYQAQEQRRAYRSRQLTPQYQRLKKRLALDDEVSAILQSLKARLDSGEVPDDGPKFFRLCLKALEEFGASIPASIRPSLADLQGAMFANADRCLHRFRRIAP